MKFFALLKHPNLSKGSKNELSINMQMINLFPKLFCSVIEKTFLIRDRRPRICKNFDIHSNVEFLKQNDFLTRSVRILSSNTLEKLQFKFKKNNGIYF